MRKVVITAADACRDTMQTGGHRIDTIMVTTTYAPESTYDPRQISELVNHMRNWLARRGIKLRYQWVMELQARGAPHHHILLWLPHKTRIPMPDKQGWWPHGMTRVELAHRAVGYLVKYATKGEVMGGDFKPRGIPPGARLFGVGGLDDNERLLTHRAGLPRWLCDAATGRCRRTTGGWIELETGQIHRTPYAVTWGVNDEGAAFVAITLRPPDS